MTSSNPRPSAQPEPVSLWSLAQFRAVFVMNLAGLSSFAVMISALPVWAVRNGIDAALAGTVMSVLLAATVATQLVSPPLMRRFTIRALLVAGLVLLGAPSLLYLWATDLGTLYAVSAVRGVGFGLLTVVAALAIQRATPTGRLGEAIGIYGLSGALPTAIGAAVGAGLTLSGHFPVVVAIGLTPLLGIFAARGISAEVIEPPSADGLPLLKALRRLVLPLTMLFVATAAGGAVITLVPLQITDSVKATSILVLFGAVAALFRWRIGIFTDLHGHQWVSQVLVVFGAVGMTLFGVGFATGSLLLLAAGVICTGASYGALQSVSLDVSFSRLPRSQAPVASAAWNAFFDTGTATGTAVFAALAATSLQGGGAMVVGAAAFVVIGVVSIPAAIRSYRRA